MNKESQGGPAKGTDGRGILGHRGKCKDGGRANDGSKFGRLHVKC